MLTQFILDLPPCLPPIQLKEEVRKAKSEATRLQAPMEEMEQKALQLERQLKEQEAKCRESASIRKELEDLGTLTRSQEQRVDQSHREAQQSQAELASLEAILALLHLREVERTICTQSNYCLCFYVICC